MSVEVCTIEQPYHKKIIILSNGREEPGGQIIMATTGSVGLAQRLQQIVQANCDSETFAHSGFVDIGVEVCKNAVYNFSLTRVPAGSIGALLAFWGKDGPGLIEFGQADFQPEVKNEDIWWVSMGSGQRIADPVLALLANGFCSDGPPRLSTGIFMTTWALRHVIETNTGGIKEPMHVAVMRQDPTGVFRAEMVTEAELGEHDQNVDSVYAYLGRYRLQLTRADAPEPPEPGES